VTKAGAANKFKRNASHSVYIRDAVKKEKIKQLMRLLSLLKLMK
jgi:hypothetical protein